MFFTPALISIQFENIFFFQFLLSFQIALIDKQFLIAHVGTLNKNPKQNPKPKQNKKQNKGKDQNSIQQKM